MTSDVRIGFVKQILKLRRCTYPASVNRETTWRTTVFFFFFRILFFIFHSSPRHRRRLRHRNNITWSKANCETWFIRRLMSHPHETVFGIRSLIAFWDFKWHTSRLIVHNFSNSTVHDGKKIRFIYVPSGRSVQNNIFPPKNMYFFIMLLTIEYDQWMFLKLIPTH